MRQLAFPILFIFLVLSFAAPAQEISIQSTNATSLKWYQVKTPSFNVLYPKGFDREAMRVANNLEVIHDPEANSMGVKPRPISVILQNQSALSNAFVTFSPRRSEFYTMPPQNYNFAGTNDWLDLLSSHEYRHVVQYQRSIVGFNKFLYYVLGQNALSLSAFAAAPQWFWEGDAVATETAFTKSGRGRIPQFALLFKTNLLEGRTFNYQKQYDRSYKHNIPDHYVLGYHMITYLRNKTNDAEIWDKVVTRAWSYPFIPFTFSRSIKKETGININQLYKEMADSLRTSWKKEIDALELSKFETITKRNSKSYIDYEYPQVLADGSIIAVKSGIGEITAIVKIKDGEVIQKFVSGPFNDAGMLSASGDKVVWNEYRYDPRWRVKNYTIVKGYDFGKRKGRNLSRKTRYAGAAISPGGDKVITVESSTSYEVKMLVLDYNTKAILKQFENPGNALIQMPRWSPDEKSIVAVRLTKEGKKLSVLDYESGAVRDVFDAGNENIGHPVMSPDGKYIFYNSPFSGIDNIYAVEVSTGNRYQVTVSKYGAYNPSIAPNSDWIYYNDQSRDGLNIVRAPYDPASWRIISQVPVPQQHFYDKIVKQEEHQDILKDIPQKNFPVSKYKQGNHLINIHSWGPFFDTDVTQADLGISSRNLLGTLTVNAGYLFDINERTGSYHAGVSYQGLYPVLDFNVLHGQRESKTGVLDKNVKLTWDETTVNGGFRIPLLLTRSKYNTSLTLKDWVGATRVSGFRNVVTTENNILYSQGVDRIVRVADTLAYVFSSEVGNGTLLYNQATVSFVRFLKQSRRDFNPKFGQQVDIELYNTPFGGDFKGKLAAARLALFFPGAAKHHSILLRGGFQKGTDGIEVNRYQFRNRVFRPRGFSYPFDTKFQSFSVNYAAPVWYPDIQLGPMLNIQRLRANVFYDFGQAFGENYFYASSGRIYYSSSRKDYESVGAEFTVDVNVMRLLPQLDLGLRTTFINPAIPSQKRLVVEFVLGTLNL